MGIILICDDDEQIAVLVEEHVSNIFVEHGVPMETKVFTKPREALNFCENNKVDFILLDIDMPGMNGFELTRRLYGLPSELTPIIIYMSSHEKLVFDSLQYKPFDFLRKSCLDEELELKIGRLIREYAYHNEQIELARIEVAYLLLRDVLYFKSCKNSIDAYTEEAVYRCKDKISIMEQKYPNCLIRAGKQYLVNVNYIQRVRTNDILLSNGMKIPMSRRKRRFVEDKYARLTRK